MASVNRVTLIGNLGRDPELRYTQAGKAVSSFSLATNEKWKDKDGQAQERVEWHRIVVWGKTAESAVQYLSKGKMVYIEGRLQTRDWEDKEGQKRQTTEIVAMSIQFLSPKDGDQGGGGGARDPSGDTPPPAGDDIPF